MATKPNVCSDERAIRETHDTGATTMTLAEYKAMTPQEAAALNLEEYAGTGGVRPGPLGSDWVSGASPDMFGQGVPAE